MFKFTAILALALSAFAAPTARQSCADVTVFFARGTTEPGTVGITVGPALRSDLERTLTGKSVSFIGVEYPADIAGFLAGGSREGAANMANGVTSTANRCPNTKIVISGYSQGAQVTHLAAERLSSAVQSRVSAAVVFGDPMKGDGFPGPINARSITFCNIGDNICSGGFLVLPAHLTYTSDTPAAARFVRDKIV